MPNKRQEESSVIYSDVNPLPRVLLTVNGLIWSSPKLCKNFLVNKLFGVEFIWQDLVANWAERLMEKKFINGEDNKRLEQTCLLSRKLLSRQLHGKQLKRTLCAKKLNDED